jgi:hypothetical protein
VVGDELSQQFSGTIAFNDARASASGLPDSTRRQLAAGQPVTVPVRITNNGAAPEDFFIDPRLDSSQAIALTPIPPTTATNSLPLTSFLPSWLVPTQTSGVSVEESSSLPAMFDFEPYPGDPDLASASNTPGPLCSDTASASYFPPGGAVTAGEWYAAPTECGPYPGPAPAGSATVTMTAQTKAFDPAVTSPTGDAWLFAVNPDAAFTPLVLGPGQTATVDVTITPFGAAGTVVRGDLYIDDLTDDVPPYAQFSGDELAALPYTYTIK